MKGSFADQLRAAGISSKQIQQFDVFSIDDTVITFPEERLNQTRRAHEKRFVIILQNNKDNTDPTIKIVTIAPLSTRSQHHRLDFLLKKQDNQFLRDDSYIRIRHIQPILKTDLATKWGNVSTQKTRENIKDRLFALYDL